MSEEKKTGVYICTGCEIGDSLDIEALEKSAGNVDICKTHASLCSSEGAAIITGDIESEGLNTVVIAACSPREKTEIFSYDPLAVSLERVNLREHVVWCQKPNDEDTQMLAEDYMSMGLVKASKMAVLEPFTEEIDKTILVVGGGITGMTSALDASKAGYEVVLVEKETELGGWMSKLHKKYPGTAPYAELQDTGISSVIEEVNSSDKIKVFTGAKIEKTAGAPGLFDITVAQNGSSETLRVGSIVEATGWEPYDASKLDHLGSGLPNVVTSVDIEQMAKEGKFARPSDGKEVKSVAFIQCAGSRDENHLPYCSSHCCLTSLKQANYIREKDKDVNVYIIYKDMRTPGQSEIYYKNAQQDDGIFLTKGEIAGVSEGSGNGILIDVDNTLIEEKIQIEADMVVLATGMVPSAGIERKELEPAEAEEGEEKKEEEEVEVPQDQIIPSDTLNLDYRQGPELPALRYGFPDSHYICFPYESRRTGIYAAGCVRHPLDAAMCVDDAAGAALKAIQCVELASQGKAVHPRSGDMSYPELYMSRCTQCKRCTEECPFGVYNEDEKGNPLPNPTRCRRCGICMGSCPERIISFKDYSIDIIGSMVKSVDVPEEDEEKPRVIAFLCENDAYPSMDVIGRKRIQYNPYIRVIPLRCLGNINLQWIADSLSKGIDGILLIGCKHGDDYQCHYVKGSELASIRISKIQETLDRLVLESERVQVEELSIDEYHKLPGIYDEFLEKLDELGPNPYKDF